MEHNGLVRPFAFDSTATLGEVEVREEQTVLDNALNDDQGDIRFPSHTNILFMGQHELQASIGCPITNHAVSMIV